jgi:hypothetical protein
VKRARLDACVAESKSARSLAECAPGVAPDLPPGGLKGRRCPSAILPLDPDPQGHHAPFCLPSPAPLAEGHSRVFCRTDT